MPSVGIIISHFGVLYPMPREFGAFLAWSVGTVSVVFSNPCRWFLFWCQIAFSHTCASHYSPGCSSRTLTDQSFVLCVPLSSLVLCFATSVQLVLPRLSALSPQLRDVCWALPMSLFPNLWPTTNLY